MRLYLILIGHLRREQDAFLADKVRIVREMLQRRPDDLSDLNEEVEQSWAPRQYARFYVRILDQKGKIIAESPAMSLRLGVDAFPKPARVGVETGEALSLVGSLGSSFRAVSARPTWALTAGGRQSFKSLSALKPLAN